MKAWEVVGNYDDVGDVFCVGCSRRSLTPVFAGDASSLHGSVCDGCGDVFDADLGEWEPCEASAVDQLREAVGDGK